MKTKSITFLFAHLDGFRFQPNEQDGKAVLEISSPLTPALADALGCKEMLYSPAGFSHEFCGSIGLPLKISDLDLIIKADAGKYTDKPTLVHAFKIASEESAEGGTQLEVSFRAHLSGDLIEAFAFCRQVNKEVCSVKLTAAQGELFDHVPEPAEEVPGAVASAAEMKRKGK